jgi:hypothetical protein
MAKDSFFIRKRVALNADETLDEVAIDLGFVVDALGKSVCRIHNIAVQYGAGYVTSGVGSSALFELSTQSATQLQTASDKSTISTGSLVFYAESPSGAITFMTQDYDVAPQDFTNGYLVAVDQLYLRGQGVNSQGWINVVLECTVETMNSSAAMALSLSQQ